MTSELIKGSAKEGMSCLRDGVTIPQSCEFTKTIGLRVKAHFEDQPNWNSQNRLAGLREQISGLPSQRPREVCEQKVTGRATLRRPVSCGCGLHKLTRRAVKKGLFLSVASSLSCKAMYSPPKKFELTFLSAYVNCPASVKWWICSDCFD